MINTTSNLNEKTIQENHIDPEQSKLSSSYSNNKEIYQSANTDVDKSNLVDEKSQNNKKDEADSVHKLHEVNEVNISKIESNNTENMDDNFKSQLTPDEIYLRNTVVTRLTHCPDDLVWRVFRDIFQPHPENLYCVYERIYQDLNFELSKLGYWEIVPFGSTVNTLALKCSDIDFYIRCIQTNIRNIHPTDTKTLFNRIKSVLYVSNYFKNVFGVPRARVPVIKLTHRLTGYSLDINLTSRHGVYNSEFIANILKYDYRIHPMLLVIKVWAKTWHISRCGGVTNYCITLMVFFYLQNCNPPVIPSIRKFQENVPKKMFDGYNFAYGIPYDFNPNCNKDSIQDLIKGFFKYYSGFDFKKYVICPYLGKPIVKTSLIHNFKNPKQEDQIEIYADKIKLNIFGVETDTKHFIGLNVSSHVVVHDPFCLSLNKFNAGIHVFRHLLDHLKMADKICNIPKHSLGQLLISLLYEKLNENSPETFQFTLGQRNNAKAHVKRYIQMKSPNKEPTEDEIEKIWSEKTIMFFIEILEKIYFIRFKLVNNDDDDDNTNKTNSAENKQENVDEMKKTYKLESNLDCWTHRKNVSADSSTELLNKVLVLSETIGKDRQTGPAFKSNLNCMLTILIQSDFKSIVFDLTNLGGVRGQFAFRTFFKELSLNTRKYIPGYFEKLVEQTKSL